MSANNELLVYKIGKQYAVFCNGCVDNCFPTPKSVKHAIYKADTLLDALCWANIYCIKEGIEYGFNYVGEVKRHGKKKGSKDR
jgi:hypothetical protein